MEAVLKAHQEAQDKRPIYVFELPEEAVELDDRYIKKSVGLVKLKMQEELKALDLAGGSAARAGYFMVLASLVEVDGRPVRRDEGEEEMILNNTDPMIRSLIFEAQSELAGSTKEAAKKFIGSRKVKIG